MKNRLVIRENYSNNIVYDQIIETFQLKHSLPANTLTNGVLYNVVVTVFDQYSQSPESNTVIFYCFKTPEWKFSNLNSNQIINNSSYTTQLEYFQSNGEVLNSWQVLLYNSSKSLLFSSGVNYQTSSLSYTISGLEDSSLYYVRSIGETLNKMQIDTGYIPVSVSYITPIGFFILNLENQADQATIKLDSNIVSILGTSNPSPPPYLDNTWVDLSLPGSWVNFKEGIFIQKDLTLELIVKTVNINTTILVLSNSTQSIQVNARIGTFENVGDKFYLELVANNSITDYVSISNFINIPSSDREISFYIRRKNNVYEIKIKE